MPATINSLLTAELQRDAARPLVTYYDGSTGERVELSVRTFDNWASKIANLVGDDLQLEPGDRCCVELPTHWQSAVLIAGAWASGLRIVGAGSEVELRIVGPDAAAGAAEHVLAVALRPLGGPFLEPLPAGWLDFAREVPPQPDARVIDVAVSNDDIAVESDGRLLTHGDLVRMGAEAAASAGVTPGGRLLTDLNPAHPEEVVTALVAPIVVGGSVVFVVNASEEQRVSIAAQEAVTAVRWRSGQV